MLLPNSFSSACFMPTLFDTPPVKTMSESSGMARSRLVTRLAEAMCTPAEMSAAGSPLARWEITSDSANTTHWLLTSSSLVDLSDSGPTSYIVRSSSVAAFSRKRPVPAAHLSFMRNFTTFPVCGSTWIALASCPPMSMMVRVPALR